MKTLKQKLRTFSWLFIMLIACLGAASADTVDTLQNLQQAVEEVRESTDTTALAVAMIDKGDLVWLDAMGLASMEHQIAATPDTLFRIGSTSKMFVALSVLKLVEEGRLDLISPLQRLAPEISFNNRWESEHPVRLVHLLEHTSGWDDLRLVEYAHNEPFPIALKDALMRYPESRSSRWVPGTRMAYSNAGPAVAAYVVEKTAGIPFEDYVTQSFFHPLRMSTATFFQPDTAKVDAATAYSQGRPKAYWHLMHRPAGAINASVAEMANLLKFFLGSGHVHGAQILAAASIDRMEAAVTTLGAEKGLTAGYGLANYTSGFEDKGFAFRGHGGGLPGATTDFAYSRELNSGYVLMLSGDGAATHRISELIRGYLLRHQPKLEVGPQPLPSSFAAVDGLFVPINPRSTRDDFLPLILSAMKFTSNGTFFQRIPVTGGWAGPSRDYAVGPNLLVDQWSGLPTVAHVTDPIAGGAIQVGADLYVRSSSMRVWGEVVVLVFLLLLSVSSILCALIWLPILAYQRRLGTATAQLLAWPALSSALLLGAASQIELSMANMDMSALGNVTALSISLFALTLGYGLLTLWSGITLMYQRKRGASRWVFGFSAILVALHLVMVFHLAGHGMIGIRTWTI